MSAPSHPRASARARIGCISLVALAGLLTLVAGAGPASAHASLVRTEPSSAAVVPALPPSVRVVFDEAPQARFSVVHVTGPDGVRRDAGSPEVSDDAVVEPLSGATPPGTYVVDWRVVSDDGHPISGSWRFTVAAPGTAGALVGGGAASAPASAPATPVARPDGSRDGGGHALHLALPFAFAVAMALWIVGERVTKRRRRSRS